MPIKFVLTPASAVMERDIGGNYMPSLPLVDALAFGLLEALCPRVSDIQLCYHNFTLRHAEGPGTTPPNRVSFALRVDRCRVQGHSDKVEGCTASA